MKVWVTEMRGVCIMKQAYDVHTVECVWNVMAHAQKPDLVLRRNGRVHLNQRGSQFSRLLAAEVCASAVVMLDTLCFEVLWRVLATQSIRQFLLHFPSRASPCAIRFQLDSTKWIVDLQRTAQHVQNEHMYFRECKVLQYIFHSTFSYTNFTTDYLPIYFYFLYTTATCFGYLSWPSSGSYKFAHVQRIWEHVIDNWHTMYRYNTIIHF